jgi:hypothetical protein
MNKNKIFKIFCRLSILALIIGTMGSSPGKANAASLTSLSDTQSRLQASTNSNHTIFFVSPTGITTNQTVILTFTGYSAATVNAILFSDVDFATGSTNVCSSATYTEQTLASSATTTSWGVSAGSSAITITAPSTGTPLAASKCVRILIGTNAVNQTTGVNQIQNGTAGATHTIAITGTFGDTGTLAESIISNDQVTITATVAPTITFTIDFNSMAFGTLSTATGRWATNGGGGNATAGSTPTAGNTFTVATNAQSGWALSYTGTVLTFGSFTIPAATISSDSDGTPGTSQFALTASASGSGPGTTSITSGYARTTNSSYKFNSGDTVASSNGAATLDTIIVSYLANISGSQQAGPYSTTLTWVATSTF